MMKAPAQRPRLFDTTQVVPVAERLVEAAHGVSTDGVQEVGVGIHGVRDGGVAEQGLDLLRVHAPFEQGRGESVA
jgi:hypothetical protein